MRAAGAIEGVIADLNNRLGQRRDSKVRIAVSIHAGRAAIGEVGSSEPPMLMAIGEAVDVANDLRKAAAERDKALAIVRSNEGVASAVTEARRYVEAAESICADLPPTAATEALCNAPRALLDSVPVLPL